MAQIIFAICVILLAGSPATLQDNLFRAERAATTLLTQLASTLDVEEELGLHLVARWPDYVAYVPAVAVLVGQLAVLSRNQDFSLDKHKPQQGLKFIKTPGTFKDAIRQLYTDCLSAFQVADKNMHGASLMLTAILPKLEQLYDSAKLPPQLGKLDGARNAAKETGDAAHKCASLAKEVDDKFESVGSLLMEIYAMQDYAGNARAFSHAGAALANLSAVKEAEAKKESEIVKNVQAVTDALKAATQKIPSSFGSAGEEIALTVGRTIAKVSYALPLIGNVHSREQLRFLSDRAVKEQVLTLAYHFGLIARAVDEQVQKSGTAKTMDIADASSVLVVLANATKTAITRAVGKDMSTVKSLLEKIEEAKTIGAGFKNQMAVAEVKKVNQQVKDMEKVLAGLFAPKNAGSARSAAQNENKAQVERMLQIYTDDMKSLTSVNLSTVQGAGDVQRSGGQAASITNGRLELFNLKRNWHSLKNFFSSLQTLADDSFLRNLRNLEQRVKTFSEIAAMNYNDIIIIKLEYGQMQESIKKFHTTAQHLLGIATVYNNVSSTYITPTLGTVGILINSKDANIEEKINQINKNATDVANQIKQLVGNYKDGMVKKILDQLKKWQ